MVGEQPGDQEDLQGRPFVGPAGKLLDRALEEAGIDRAEVYVTNAVKHFKFEPRGKRRIHKKPDRPEIEACKWWLERELAVLKPGPAGGCGSRRSIRLRWLAVSGQTAAILVVGALVRLPAAVRRLLRADLALRLAQSRPADRLSRLAPPRPELGDAAPRLRPPAARRAALSDRRAGEPVRHPAARAGDGLRHDAAARQDVPARRDDARRGDRARLHPRAAALVPGRGLRRAAPLCRRRLGGARLRARLHGVLCLPRRGGGAPARRRARRDRAGAAARAASLGARRPRRRGGARARHAARHDRARRQRAGAASCRRTIRTPRTSG